MLSSDTDYFEVKALGPWTSFKVWGFRVAPKLSRKRWSTVFCTNIS